MGVQGADSDSWHFRFFPPTGPIKDAHLACKSRILLSNFDGCVARALFPCGMQSRHRVQVRESSSRSVKGMGVLLEDGIGLV
jgi:hypothetical protein